LKLSIVIITSDLRVKWLKARRQNDPPYVYFYLVYGLIEIYSVILTDSFANTTFLLFKEKAVFIHIRVKGNCLSEVYMDGLIRR
jgi:hypothetical protein